MGHVYNKLTALLVGYQKLFSSLSRRFHLSSSHHMCFSLRFNSFKSFFPENRSINPICYKLNYTDEVPAIRHNIGEASTAVNRRDTF